MKIDYECKIAQDGYEWNTQKLSGRELVFLVPKTKKIKTAPFPDDAYTLTCTLGWELKKEGANAEDLILAHVKKFGSLEGAEGSSRRMFYQAVETESKQGERERHFYPTVESYTEFAVSLYEQRLDMIEGLPKYAIERNIEAEVTGEMSVVKRVVGNKIELFAKPYLLSTAIDLQFIMYQGMVGHYTCCETCQKPIMGKRVSRRYCPETSTCRVTARRKEQKLKEKRK